MPADADACDLLCLDLAKAERLRALLRDHGRLDADAAAAKALGEPTRLAISLALSAGGELCVCDLSWVVSRDEKLVSHHVRLLKAAGLVSSRRDGRMALYELTERGRHVLRPFAMPAETT